MLSVGSRIPGILLTPTFPSGTWLYGWLVAVHRLNGRKFPGTWLQRAKDETRRTTVSGVNPSALTTALALASENGVGAPAELLHSHTLFGYYQRGLTAPLAQRWGEMLLSDKLGRGPGPLQFLWKASLSARGRLRWCPVCASLEHEQGFLATWHSLHQVPYLHHCFIHGVPLVSQCAHCARILDRGWHQRLPSDPCRACGSTAFEGEVSKWPAGYWGVADLALRLARNEIGMRSDQWLQICDSAARSAGGMSNVTAAVRGEILARWSATDIGDICATLKLPSLALDLHDARSAQYSPTLVERLIFADAFLSAGLAVPSDFDLVDGTPRVTEESGESALKSQIASLLDSEELPTEIAQDYLDGMPIKAICAKHSVTMRRLDRVRGKFPADLRAQADERRFRSASTKGNRRKGKPNFRGLDPRARTEAYRELLESLVAADPEITKLELRRAAQIPYQHILLHDPGWIGRRLGSPIDRRTDAIRARHRATAEAFFSLDSRRRGSFQKAHGDAYAWLRRMDRSWFNKLLASGDF